MHMPSPELSNTILLTSSELHKYRKMTACKLHDLVVSAARQKMERLQHSPGKKRREIHQKQTDPQGTFCCARI